MPRSNPSTAIATLNPSCSGPSTLSVELRAPVKNVASNSRPLAMLRIGLVSTPACRMSISSTESPLGLCCAGSVRTTA